MGIIQILVALIMELHGHACQLQNCQWAFEIISVSSQPEFTRASSGFPLGILTAVTCLCSEGCKLLSACHHHGGDLVSHWQEDAAVWLG